MTRDSECSTHRGQSERWVVCIHTEAIRVARLTVENYQCHGEAVCEVCKLALERGERLETLRFACGGCVRERWPLEGAS